MLENNYHLNSLILAKLKTSPDNYQTFFKRIFFSTYYLHNGPDFLFNALDNGKIAIASEGFNNRQENLIYILSKLESNNDITKSTCSATSKSNKKTLLHLALELGMIHLAEKLIDMGADIKAKESNGVMPITYIQQIFDDGLSQQSLITSVNNSKNMSTYKEVALNNVFIKLLDGWIDFNYPNQLNDSSITQEDQGIDLEASTNQILNDSKFSKATKEDIKNRVMELLDIVSLYDLHNIFLTDFVKNDNPNKMKEFHDFFVDVDKFKKIKQKCLENKFEYDINQFSYTTNSTHIVIKDVFPLPPESKAFISSYLNRKDTDSLCSLVLKKR